MEKLENLYYQLECALENKRKIQRQECLVELLKSIFNQI